MPKLMIRGIRYGGTDPEGLSRVFGLGAQIPPPPFIFFFFFLKIRGDVFFLPILAAAGGSNPTGL